MHAQASQQSSSPTQPPPVFQMIAKAVDAAAPSRERDAWYERRAHWEGTARRRQEARAAAPSHSVVHAQSPAAGSGFARWLRGVDARGGGRRNGGSEEASRGGGEEDDDGNGDGFRLNKMQSVIAVAVMLVLAVFRIRSTR